MTEMLEKALEDYRRNHGFLDWQDLVNVLSTYGFTIVQRGNGAATNPNAQWNAALTAVREALVKAHNESKDDSMRSAYINACGKVMSLLK